MTELMDKLFDYLADRPDGATMDEIAAVLDVTHRKAKRVVRELRLFLGGDSINLTADPQGSGEPWLYRLVGDVDNARAWVANQWRHAESRLETMIAFTESLLNATDGRSLEGRKARVLNRHLVRAKEDLTEIGI